MDITEKQEQIANMAFQPGRIAAGPGLMLVHPGATEYLAALHKAPG